MRAIAALLADFSMLALAAFASAGPEYLEKVDEIDPPEYGAFLARHLFLTPGDFGRMVYMPSFHGEVVVSVYCDAHPTGDQEDGTCHITVTEAQTSLFENRPKDADVKVKRTDADIDAEFAFLIRKAWREVLAHDPIPTEGERVTLDGMVGYFSVARPDGKPVIRITSNPERPPASEMLDIGTSLAVYCTVPAEQRKMKREEILRKLHQMLTHVQ